MSYQAAMKIEAARQRVRDAEEKFNRQQKRYALAALESEKPAKSEKAQTAKTRLHEIYAELEASRGALRALEEPR